MSQKIVPFVYHSVLKSVEIRGEALRSPNRWSGAKSGIGFGCRRPGKVFLANATMIQEPTPKDSTQKMQTLSECMNGAVEKGYTENYKVEGKMLTSGDGEATYTPDQVVIPNYYRFEGYSDPADNSILYLLETADGKKGMLLDAYDAYADARISNFVREVEEIAKKAPHDHTKVESR
jgi:hypothetical protein